MNDHLVSPSSSPQNTTKLKHLSLHHPQANVMHTHHHHHHPHSLPDEGYSEAPDNTSLTDDTEMSMAPVFDVDISDSYDLDTNVQKLIACIGSLPPAKRKEVVEALIPTLPNEHKEEIKALIEHLTHFDPAVYLPNEIFLLIFAYLTPRDLLGASTVSRAWRVRAQDERLWRACFAREGWMLDQKQLAEFEEMAEKRGKRHAETALRNAAKARLSLEERPTTLQRRESRKRGRDEAFNEAGSTLPQQSEKSALAQPNAGGAVHDRASDADTMEGVEETHSHSARTDISPSFASRKAIRGNSENSSTNPADFHVAPPVFQSARSHYHPHQPPKVSWSYLYKQRRRLETNWEHGRYKMFQLPHPDHPDEGHNECVYTIQHTARHLVSGSRDQTIRVWDLATQRLKAAPLVGHEASVLCLQFDERPEQDIIVSGGSDTFLIVWKFSTGEILKKITAAHDGSVLNLRFDDRYIVTCSKDKTIKVWTRHALTRDSPNVPAHVLQNWNDLGKTGGDEMIAEYSLLTSLLGHQAAVNAVMIHDSIVVSASGDRTIKSWDLNTSGLKKTYTGHSKGIACVQFDGRRIVSGSSDNTVRIFDAEQQAEIACLTGHQHLVRTVQARFGDLETVSAEELAEEARKADAGFYAALARGMQPASVSRRHGGGARNAGSSKPEHMLALGTKVPPGGGGSRWAKIVSGSYDETVIVWKRDSEGKWCPRLRLQQNALIRPTHRQRTRLQPANANAPAATGNAPAATGSDAVLHDGSSSLVQAQAQHHIATAHGHLAQATQLLHTHHHQPGGPAPHAASASNAGQLLTAMTDAQNSLTQHSTQTTHHQHGAANQAATTTTTSTAEVPNASADVTSTQSPTAVTASAAALAAQQPQALLMGPSNIPPGAPTAGVAGQPNPLIPIRDSNRVFKLQFDARRIVCCSQNKVIVGWDFANDDPELEMVGLWSLETA